MRRLSALQVTPDSEAFVDVSLRGAALPSAARARDRTSGPCRRTPAGHRHHDPFAVGTERGRADARHQPERFVRHGLLALCAGEQRAAEEEPEYDWKPVAHGWRL